MGLEFNDALSKSSKVLVKKFSLGQGEQAV